MNTASKKKKFKSGLRSPLGLMLILVLVVLLLVLNVLAFSYSWFTPTQETKSGLQYDDTLKLRSEYCEFKTYQGTLVTETNWETTSAQQVESFKSQGYYIDQICYNKTAIANNVEITVHSGERIYFRTEIQNQDTNYPSVISLYHHRYPANLSLAITYPSNTFWTPDDTYDDCFILRNAYVKPQDNNDVDGPGILRVEWFVENNTNSDIPLRVTPQTTGTALKSDGQTYETATAENPIYWLYLMYN